MFTCNTAKATGPGRKLCQLARRGEDQKKNIEASTPALFSLSALTNSSRLLFLPKSSNRSICSGPAVSTPSTPLHGNIAATHHTARCSRQFIPHDLTHVRIHSTRVLQHLHPEHREDELAWWRGGKPAASLYFVDEEPCFWTTVLCAASPQAISGVVCINCQGVPQEHIATEAGHSRIKNQDAPQTLLRGRRLGHGHGCPGRLAQRRQAHCAVYAGEPRL